MSYSFQNRKAIYTPYNGRIYLDLSEGEVWYSSEAYPVNWDDDRCQIYVRDDDVQLRLSIKNVPTNTDILTVKTKYRPEIPCLFPVVRDAAPYNQVGIAVLSPNGNFRVVQSAAGNVQIFGNYKVKSHD